MRTANVLFNLMLVAAAVVFVCRLASTIETVAKAFAVALS